MAAGIPFNGLYGIQVLTVLEGHSAEHFGLFMVVTLLRTRWTESASSRRALYNVIPFRKFVT